ncbi:MAG: D-tyrosyl-tRNA(Tyr) deacylase [Lachnospiraceae bacterium]|nr:D-tyrosyl-tRNA(Tyr) deacylase [Lachnospiraceae bacterium]MBQ6094995.1 D-tyrosyl-tRNA(Tyr) deacylase [Lachnospiraceae bacterium]
MRFVIQRTKNASVTVDGKVIGAIEKGFMVLIGVTHDDTVQIADKMISKLLGLRIFEDAEGKTNLDLNSVNGNLLLVPQFTLYADCRKGNRPSFTDAARPPLATDLYEYVVKECRRLLGESRVQTGSFGADMKVSLLNDGPFTVLLDSKEIVPNVHPKDQ